MASLRCSIPEKDFWHLTMRQLDRAVRVHSETVELDFMRSALETAYMMNMVGGAAAGKKWKQVKPNTLLKQWLGSGKSNKEDRMERIKRAMRLHKERMEREKNRRSTSP